MKHLAICSILLLVVGTVVPAQGIETLNPSHDTFIDQYGPNNINGTKSAICVRNMYGSGARWELDGLFKFDIHSIPKGAAIAAAKLYVYYYRWHDTNPKGRTLTCHRITSTWDEKSVNWNTRPKYDTVSTSGAPVPASYTWMSWDVAVDVRDFVNGTKTNHGWQIMDLKKWGTVNIPMMYFYSREFTSLRPYLEIALPTHLAVSGSPRPGGTVTFGLTAVNDKGLAYQVGSSFGTGPIPIDSREILLSVDPLLLVSLSGALPGIFEKYTGFIDAQGKAGAALKIPGHQGLIGLKIHTAFVTLSGSAPSGVKSISNTFSLSIMK